MSSNFNIAPPGGNSGTQKERSQRIEVSYNQDNLRPYMHGFSQVTTALFIMMAAVKTGYLNELLQWWTRPVYAILFVACYYFARRVESVIAAALDGVSFNAVRVRKRPFQATMGMLIVLPIAAISAITSYSGIAGNIDPKDLGIDKVSGAVSNGEAIKSNASKSLKADIAEYKKQREELRKGIEDSRDKKKANASARCKAAHTDKESVKQCVSEANAEIESKCLTELELFDTETRSALRDKEELVNRANREGLSQSEKLVGLTYKEADHKAAHISWIAGFLGIIAVFSEVFALFLGILIHYECYDMNISITEMRNEAKQIIKQNGTAVKKGFWAKIFGKP